MKNGRRVRELLFRSAVHGTAVALLVMAVVDDSKDLLAAGKKPSTGRVESIIESTAGFVAGDPGNLQPVSAGSADFLMAADGITVQGLGWEDCFNLYGPGNLRLDMLSAVVEEDGGVSASVDGTRLSLVSVPAVLEGDGCRRAVAYYRVPDEFNRGGDESLSVRGVTIEMRFIPDSGGPFVLSWFVDLVRPPVVFVHGLWSSSYT